MSALFPMPPASVPYTGGGSTPRWSRDGRELHYIASNNTVMAATVTTGASFEVGKPKFVFTVAGRIRGWTSPPTAVSCERGRGASQHNSGKRPGRAAGVVSNWQTSLQ